MATMEMDLVPEPEQGGPLDVRHDRAGEPVSVRPYRPSDRDELERFYEEFEPQRAAQGLPPTGRARIARWLQGVLPRGIHLVARRGETLIGHALVVPSPGRADTAEYAVFLDQRERGKGLGVELTRAAIDLARDAGFTSLWLTVEPANRAAVRAYERVGFRFRPATRYSHEAEMTLDLVA
jgi:RimJ/RimL family protein N-acetyltransferase